VSTFYYITFLFEKQFSFLGWLSSGDIAYIDGDGELYIVDRLKDLIKYRGCQISPAEIEVLLHTHPGVIEAAVFGVPHPIDDEHPVAFVTIKLGFTV
jgi:acyl-coenzyme A synthetase/AMP-(fatty) acid ligase